MPNIVYSTNDIRAHVSNNAFRAGEIYCSQGRVSGFTRTEDTISASVQGNERQPYKQTITLERDAGLLQIDGQCTCPVGFNCKHVVAALLQGLKKGEQKPPSREETVVRAVARLLDTPRQQQPAAAPLTPDLPHSIVAWLNELDLSQKTATEDYPTTVAQRIVYVFTPIDETRSVPRLGVTPMSVRQLKDGRFAENGKPYKFNSYAAPAQFLRPSDTRILQALERVPIEYQSKAYPLGGAAVATVFREMIETGRARWRTVNGPAMTEGEPRPGQLEWNLTAEATMQARLDAGDGLLTFAAAPPFYVDPQTGTIGTVETGHPPKIAATLLAAPAIHADKIAALNEALAKRLPGLPAARPPEPAKAETIAVAPQPHLRLFTAALPSATAYAYQGYQYVPVIEQVALARLVFRYGPVTLPLGETRAQVTHVRDGRLVTVVRDDKAERAHLATLLMHNFLPLAERRPSLPKDHAHDLIAGGDESAWFDVLYRELPALEAQGWTVEIAEDFPFQLLRGDGSFDADLHEGSGIDWFEFGLGVMIDGERIDLIGPIVSMIEKPSFDASIFEAAAEDDAPFYLPLADGRVLAIPAARLAPIVAAIQELASASVGGNGRLRLTRADAAGLAAFEDATGEAGVVWRGGEALRAMGRKLTASSGIPAAVLPDTFTATLRPYQADGFSWLAFLRDVGLGGVLADDMGLGKTVQALALIASEKAEGRLDAPALVIAPTSLMANWRREAERFAPGLRVLTLHGLERKKTFDRIPHSDLVLTTYPLIARDHEVLGETAWHLVILDEAQTIKNPDATTTKRILAIEARHRFCLTGTPLENHLGELWSLFSFALPGLLGDRQTFTRHWRTPIEKRGEGGRAQMLARRVKPFLLRRTKEEVANELPPKTEIAERIEFQPGQRDIYESIRVSMHKRVQDAIATKGFARSRIIILDALLKLRQACCDPRLLKLSTKAAAKAGSAKLERLEEMLSELLAEGRRILVFSQFTSMLDLIRPRLDAAGVRYSLLTGSTRDRETEIRRFQDGVTPVFLVSLKAGGVGLNLTAADTVILYDPWWNPAVEEQAIDRAHRIGQDKPVFVHKLVAVGTIEEKMEVLKEKKRALAESLFDHDGTPTLAMTESDLDMLFAAD